MAQLQITLQRGFAGDTIAVEINNEQVFYQQDVLTKMLLGYAEKFEVQVAEGSVDVIVRVVTQKLSNSVTLQVPETSYLGVSVENGEILFTKSDKRFGYA